MHQVGDGRRTTAGRDEGRYDGVALACDGGHAERPFLLEARGASAW